MDSGWNSSKPILRSLEIERLHRYATYLDLAQRFWAVRTPNCCRRTMHSSSVLRGKESYLERRLPVPNQGEFTSIQLPSSTAARPKPSCLGRFAIGVMLDADSWTVVDIGIPVQLGKERFFCGARDYASDVRKDPHRNRFCGDVRSGHVLCYAVKVTPRYEGRIRQNSSRDTARTLQTPVAEDRAIRKICLFGIVHL